jgi:hypothetical protein
MMTFGLFSPELYASQCFAATTAQAPVGPAAMVRHNKGGENDLISTDLRVDTKNMILSFIKPWMLESSRASPLALTIWMKCAPTTMAVFSSTGMTFCRPQWLNADCI